MAEHSFIHKVSSELPPTILTIFGATGDLSADYLLPALMHMKKHKLLPKDFKLVCVGRKELDAKGYLKFILKKSEVLKKVSVKEQAAFLKHVVYYEGDFERPESFMGLAKVLSDQEKPKHACYNRLFYFATKPQQFASITHILQSQKLLQTCDLHGRQSRVLVEKPFGFNLKSSHSLNSLLLKYFKEEQIYRIDHYMGKETVQNLMVVRFANRLFEPLWNKDFIDHIQINVLYSDHTGSRAQYFDEAGSLKDIVQNHALQMLSLVTMDEPKELTTKLIRDEKKKILEALRPFDKKSASQNVIKGQYAEYEKEIGRPSPTDTFVALKTFIDTKRWEGVPVYIRTGMALEKKVTEISIHFKELERCLFRNCAANILTFRIQPDESVYMQINNKIPGFGIELHQALLEFGYKSAFKGEIPSAYERLLLDFMEGDQRLFIRSDEIEAAWKFVDTICENWKDLPLYKYKSGSTGPAEAEEFIKKDIREWWTK